MANFPLFPPSILAKGDSQPEASFWIIVSVIQVLMGTEAAGGGGPLSALRGRADVAPWNPHTPRPLELPLGQEWFGCVPGVPGVWVGVTRMCLETRPPSPTSLFGDTGVGCVQENPERII